MGYNVLLIALDELRVSSRDNKLKQRSRDRGYLPHSQASKQANATKSNEPQPLLLNVVK